MLFRSLAPRLGEDVHIPKAQALSRSFNQMNSRENRTWPQRRRAAWDEVNRTRKHRDLEAERLIEFASMWAPYGGPNDEEILVHFGMSRLRFTERLWQVIPGANCVLEEIRTLASAYPAPRRADNPHPVP